ncbi:hypothetical protein VPNG_04795 [Cytospora leucostoma]|uniref:Uncharacterized protein n=1 Tax=Cytospora leucostoma TaxID=1230097 RepID=A0A423XBD9_9PEZI|nr:hypothetical protein VPNG_04795 [Cytospora leucostoma]
MANNVTDLESDDSGMLRGEGAQAVLDIDTLTPLSDAEEADAQQHWGGDYRQWPSPYQQRWLRRYNEDDREEYVDSRTWKLYQIRLNSVAAGLSTQEEDQAIRDLESLTPMVQAERDWMTRRFKSANPSDWPPLARRRHIRSLDRSQWRAELERAEPARPPAQGNTPCNACQLTNEAAYCDADLEQSGEDCEWLAAPINLHYACGNCTRKGAECRPQEDGPSDLGPLPQRATEWTIMNFEE